MTGDQIAAIVGSVAWPAVAVVALILLRGPLTAAVTELGRRTTRLDLQVVAFEFAQRIAPDWRVDVAGRATDVRHLTSDLAFDSYSYTLFEQLAKAGPTGALVIDLGEGREWLTTRLYLFCTLLERLRGVRCVVLLRSLGGQQGQVLGAASPSAIRGALASEQPWLESTFASAWHEAMGVTLLPEGDLVNATGDVIQPRNRSMDVQVAQQVARTYVRLNQRHNPPVGDEGEWQEFTELPPGSAPAAQPSLFWEHTTWLNPAALPRSLSAALDTRSVVPIDPSASESTEKRLIMLQEGEFVMLVHRDGALRGIVQRSHLVDTAMRAALRPD